MHVEHSLSLKTNVGLRDISAGLAPNEMEFLREDACDSFLRRIKSRSSDCKMHEIRGSGKDAIYSERTVSLDEVQKDLRCIPSQPRFKLITLPITAYLSARKVPFEDFSWIPGVAKELGIDSYLLGHLSVDGLEFKTIGPDVHGSRKVLAMYVNTIDIRMIASYNLLTRSTTCIMFHMDGYRVSRLFRRIPEYMEQNRGLHLDSQFLPLLLMDIFIKETLDNIDPYGGGDYDRGDESNLRKWENARSDLRSAQKLLHLATSIADCLRNKLDITVEQDNSDALSQHSLDECASTLKAAFDVMESRIAPTLRLVEWSIRYSDDFMAKISRKLMRQDTLASIELTKAGIDLTRAAKIDSSSMKVIAVMTMIFLPGTFFAALFAVPSLNWNDDKVVGQKFWIYWAFTVPSTLLIVILWLAITQRRQMASLFEESKKQWFAKMDVLKARLPTSNGEDGGDDDELPSIEDGIKSK
ncbi:hypothetical protein M426DRAFT_319102 [Hypoxylon sp. CI-4A]|nr:hypothetical protein M426DRAFT_319102 [Hypoxylon sp. CI-4A]